MTTTPVLEAGGFPLATVNAGSERLGTSFDRAALPHFLGPNLHLAIPTLFRFSRTELCFQFGCFIANWDLVSALLYATPHEHIRQKDT